jgi:hypothetical protein
MGKRITASRPKQPIDAAAHVFSRQAAQRIFRLSLNARPHDMQRCSE